MLGVLIGHGSTDGKRELAVPPNLQVDFFTTEGAPLAFVNLLELLKRDDPRFPLEVKRPGTKVFNYEYASFEPHEQAAVQTFDELVLPPSQMVVVGSAGGPKHVSLCSAPDTCLPDKPHQCDGVFGMATRGKWTQLLVLACRTNTVKQQKPPKHLNDANGHPTEAAYDAYMRWGEYFLTLDVTGRDTAWQRMDPRQQTYRMATSADVREFADGLAARAKLDAAQDRGAAAAAIAPTVKVVLMRDYPAYREILKTGVVLTQPEKEAIAAFKALNLQGQLNQWADMTVHRQPEQARWMTDPAVVSLAAAIETLTLFSYGLRGNALATLVGRLDAAASTIVLGQSPVAQELQHLSQSK